MQKLQSQRNKLDSLFKKIGALQDTELQGHFARYLCILVSGFLENALEAIYSTYASDKAHSHVANYVAVHLGSIRNPNMERILQLSGSFNPQWRNDIEQNIQPDVKDAVNSIMNLRNQIAHGEDAGIGYVTIKSYYDRVLTLIDFLRQQCSV